MSSAERGVDLTTSWNLTVVGRAGYGGTLDGMWPYSYNECDVGTLKNQSKDGEVEP
jgi:beta-glucanase (GH16 family)